MDRRALCAGGLAGLLPLAAEGAAFIRSAVGTVERVQRRAEAVYEQRRRTLEASAHVLFADTLKTGEGARLQARLDDGAAVTLGENAELLVDEFVYRPWSDDNKLALRVVSGAFLFVGGRIERAANARVTITTPVATLGIRGTTVWGGPIDGTYGVLVLSGVVDVATAAGTVTLSAGSGTLIHGSAAPQPAAPWPDDRTRRAVATISFGA